MPILPPTKGGKGFGRFIGKGKGKGKGTTVVSAKGNPPRKSGSIHSTSIHASTTKKGGVVDNAGKHIKKNARKKKQPWSYFIHSTLRQVNKKISISMKSMNIMNSFLEDMFERIHTDSVNIAKINKTKTLTAREVQTAARLILPGDLSRHAMSEGKKAVAQYANQMEALKQVTAPKRVR